MSFPSGISTARYCLSPSNLPLADDDLGVYFKSQVLNGRSPVCCLYPNAPERDGTTMVRFGVGMKLTCADGLVADQQGQLVVTNERLLGMFTSGSIAGTTLDEEVGETFVFSLNLCDIASLKLLKNWWGRPFGVFLVSKEDLDPPFFLDVSVVAARITNNGVATRANMRHLLPLLPGLRQ